MVRALASEKIFQRLLNNFAAGIGNGFGEWNLLRANFDAILGEAALLDSTIAHERLEPFMLESLAGGVLIKQPYLRDGGRAYEAGFLIELRASLHATAAGDTARDGIGLFLFCGIDARAGAKIVGSIHRYPGLGAFEVFKKNIA